MPESSRFDLVFSGRILPQFDLHQVRTNLQRLFTANELQLERMFSGEPVVLKSKLTREDAEKYKLALNRQGAECELRARPVEAADTQSAGSADSDPGTENKRSVIDDILAGITWDLAPVGSRMGPERKSSPAPILQTASFDLAPAGSTIGEKKSEPAPVLPDISHLSVRK